MIYKLAIAFCAALSFASAQSVSTVIFVRHAERAASTMSGGDQGLSPAGVKRAEQLAHVLQDAQIQYIYTSTKARTIETARPLAERLHVTPRRLDDTALMLREILTHPGQTTLVVHHSDTIPNMMDLLGVHNVPPIGDSQYDWLFIVTVRGPGNSSLLALRYGDEPALK